MGNLFTRFKEKLNLKKSQKEAASSSAPTQSLPLPSQAEQERDAQRGLADEHLAAVAPPSQFPRTQAQEEGKGQEHLKREEEEIVTGRKGEEEGVARTGGEEVIQKVVGTQAPVPLGVADSANTGTKKNETNTATTTTTADVKNTNTEDKMASDEDYASFLDKANQDPNEGVVKKQDSKKGGGKIEFKAVDKEVEVPAVLKKATKDAFYVSDADEPFVPVCLTLPKGEKKLPDEENFAKLIGHPKPSEAEVEIMDIGEWDTQGEYKELAEATREASKGSDVRVYKIEKEGARVEYWLVSVYDGKLVGVKALAVES